MNVYDVIISVVFSGGECKDDFCRTVDKCTDLLPDNKPRYLMGVGFSEDLVVCVALGIDMFDCVFPTRTAVCNSLFPLDWLRMKICLFLIGAVSL